MIRFYRSRFDAADRRTADREEDLLSDPVFQTSRWRWKLRRLKNDVEGWWSDLQNRMRGAGHRYKMCPRCRLLMNRGERVCTQCGYRFSIIERLQIAKALRVFGVGDIRLDAVQVIIFLNLLIYVIGLMFSGAKALDPGPGGIFNFLGASDEVQIRMGVLRAQWVLGYGEYWRLVAACFLHAGILHIGFNMMVLAQVGPTLERALGRSKFIVAYFVSGVGGFLLSLPGLGETPTLGASGAVFGVVGALVAYGLIRGDNIGRAIVQSLIRWIIMVVLLGFFMGGVNNAAHIGGGLMGAGVVFLGGIHPARTKAGRIVWGGLEAVCFLLTLVTFGYMIHGILLGW